MSTAKSAENTSVKSINEYLADFPKDVQNTLNNLRLLIKSIVPGAEETISYRIPTFKYNGPLVGFAAFKDHCSFFVMSSSLLKEFGEELKPYKTSTGTIKFTAEKPLPDKLIRKLVLARIKENEALLLAKKKPKTEQKKSAKLSDEGQVKEYMRKLSHPLKAEIEAVRSILLAVSKIKERIKWNAPSYYYKEDLVTFNLRALESVHLVFHHASIVKIKSELLEGAYKDRRMVYLHNMKEVNKHKRELQNIMKELVSMMEQ